MEQPVRKFNPVAYERIFDTMGGYFWDYMMHPAIKNDFLVKMYRWKNPMLSYKVASNMAVSVRLMSWKEFEPALINDIRTFQKIYAHDETFFKWLVHTYSKKKVKSN